MQLRGLVQRLASIALAAFVLAGQGQAAQSNELEERNALAAFFTKNFEAGDYAALDTWYDKALKEKARFQSGVFRANRLVRSIHFNLKPCSPFGPVGACPLVYDPAWVEQQQKARAWLEKFPRSTLASIVLSKAYDGQAWEHRGDGYASTVSTEDMNTFMEYNQQAIRTLLAQAELGRKDPNWWSRLLETARNGGVSRQDYAQLSKDAIAAFPSNQDIYFAASEGLLPQWGGSYKAMAQLAAQAVENTKAEDGQSFYARIYWNLYYQLPDDGTPEFTRPDVNWVRIRAGFDDLIQRYPSNVNINAYAMLACLAARDKSTTAKLIQRMGSDIVQRLWQDRAQFMHCKSWSQEEVR